MITNVKVYDLDESIKASGYPVRTTTTQGEEVTTQDVKRIVNLTKLAKNNSAHGQWLTGVRVAFDVRFSNKAWVEAERYRFLEFVSSQSTMHCITKFDLKQQCNKYVDPRIIDIVQDYIDEYNRLNNLQQTDEISTNKRNAQLNKLYLQILYNIPSGFELTARLTTNYRCLLNIYYQRFNHRLPEWKQFCEELLQLPYFKTLVDAYILQNSYTASKYENIDENQISIKDWMSGKYE